MIGPWKISYSILTMGRQEPYLERLVENLWKTGLFGNSDNLPVRLVPHMPKAGYLDQYRKDSRFYVEDIGGQEASERDWVAAGEPLREKWGHFRCLHPDRAEIEAGAILVLEDDIKLSDGWISHLTRSVQELVNVYGRRWLLSLYSPMTKEPLKASTQGHLWISRSYDGFFGAQATLYPVGVRDEYMAYLTARASDKPHDLSLSDVMRILRIPMFTTAPCLVQHMEVAHEGAKVHRSESFVDNG